jgi:hypothetical protein
MPIKKILDYCKKYGKRYGSYWGVEYESGNRFLWKRGWKRAMDISKDEVLVERGRHQLAQFGELKESLLGYVAARAVFECGHLSREVGRRVLNFPPATLPKSLTEKEIRKIIISYWHPQRDTNGNYIAGENVPQKNLSVTTFFRDNYSAYRFIAKHLGGLRRYLESSFPGLYTQVSSRRMPPNQMDREALAKELIERHNSGLCISGNLLKSFIFEERELYRRIKDSYPDFFNVSHAKRVSELTGLPEDSISLNTGQKCKKSHIEELLTNFLFQWSFLLGNPVFGFEPQTKIFDGETKRAFRIRAEDNGELCLSDLRLGNTAIEVKSYSHRMDKPNRENLIKRYGSGNSSWSDNGCDLENNVVIFHCQNAIYSNIAPKLHKAGIRVISYEEFHEELKKLIGEMKTKSSMYRDVRPICSLDYLVDLHEETSLHPFLLIRAENSDRRELSSCILQSLVDRAKELKLKQGGKHVH